MNTEKLEKLEKMYQVDGVIGITQFIIMLFVAIKHFVIGSIVFSKLVPFCAISALIGLFSMDVAIKQRFSKYNRNAFLNSRVLFYLLTLNFVIAMIIMLD